VSELAGFVTGELMKIDPNIQSIVNSQSDAVQNSKISRAQEGVSESSSSGINGSDTVQLSSKFSEAQQLTAKLQQLPEIRSERIANLKEKIQQGTYNPDSAEVAGALLNSAVSQGNKS
jgi:negative regulator of flagellin synthesis FlgM